MSTKFSGVTLEEIWGKPITSPVRVRLRFGMPFGDLTIIWSSFISMILDLSNVRKLALLKIQDVFPSCRFQLKNHRSSVVVNYCGISSEVSNPP